MEMTTPQKVIRAACHSIQRTRSVLAEHCDNALRDAMAGQYALDALNAWQKCENPDRFDALNCVSWIKLHHVFAWYFADYLDHRGLDAVSILNDPIQLVRETDQAQFP